MFGASAHDSVKWNCHIRIGVFEGVDLNDLVARREYENGLLLPTYVIEQHGNLLLTAGATALWNGLTTSGLGTPFNSSNSQIAIGDATTSPSAGQTDLQAAAGSNIATSGLSAATNVSPIVITNGSGNWTVTPTPGQVVVVASVNGNTAANGTFEVQAATANTITLKNSTGNGAFSTSSSATVKVINYYRQLVSGSPTVSTNQVQFSAIYGTSNGNFAWNEWGVSTGGGVTNQQAQPPPTLLNRAAPAGGLLTKTSNVSCTFTVTISLT